MQSKTVHKHLPIPFRVPQQVAHHHRQFSRLRVHAHQSSSSGSYDSEGDELLKEFQQYADPNKLQKISKRLELSWSVDRRRQPAPCDCCDGSGQKECTWCRGTGAMMVGEELFCSLANGCKQCPICNSKGHVRCDHCKGTGFRAGWMEPGCPA